VGPYLEKPITKKAGGVAQGIAPKFKPQYHKKKIAYPNIIDQFSIFP
jgi:hypothetical protein